MGKVKTQWTLFMNVAFEVRGLVFPRSPSSTNGWVYLVDIMKLQAKLKSHYILLKPNSSHWPSKLLHLEGETVDNYFTSRIPLFPVHQIWYAVSYGILCHCGEFWMTLLMNKWTNVDMHGGWIHPFAKILPSLVSNLWWNVVMDDWKLDEKSLGKW